MRSRALQRKQSWGKQSSAGYSVAAAFHTGGAGDMSCEWIECEPSSHSSGNIILSLASLCLFCMCLAIFRLSPPVHEQQAKSGLRPRSCAG